MISGKNSNIFYFYICCMSRRWRSYLSLVVLVSFVALLVPKSVWHDCHEHAQFSHVDKHQHSGTSIQQGYEKCAVCDLHIPLLSNPVNAAGVSLTKSVAKTIGLLSVDPVCFVPLQHYLRGPPALVNS